ncbi:acyl-homoserine-lactone synthase TraI [Rhizobiaceae bacterium n13]|uniref:Acyl-homoserine-lactone synthase n=1 Tax=Ferirhizobium litorale TaxID=2927786 RepID=A0AAE3QFY2_9HYPH|nr:acyl-homoserine-lactone synthase TraI [Fererhizobium litorale]MDI7864974.1 acyl-homoserine-lactone synthase TraI [Fererhizobium litorale]MDI7925067.1 acyl-homoserine-lactone synthase TraI [Fererhizobium litorale]
MQVMAISRPRNAEEAELLHAHRRLRAEVFSGRLGWEVQVSDGIESDGFDDLRPTYILAVSAAGRVVGCARLLPALGPTMVQDVFASLLPEGKIRAHSAMIESSRFCVDTRVGGRKGRGAIHHATLAMFAGIVEWSIANGYHEIVTVTDLRFERILSRVGWPLQRLGTPQKIGITTAVAGTLPANESTFQRLRPVNYSSLISPKGEACDAASFPSQTRT